MARNHSTNSCWPHNSNLGKMPLVLVFILKIQSGQSFVYITAAWLSSLSWYVDKCSLMGSNTFTRGRQVVLCHYSHELVNLLRNRPLASHACLRSLLNLVPETTLRKNSRQSLYFSHGAGYEYERKELFHWNRDNRVTIFSECTSKWIFWIRSMTFNPICDMLIEKSLTFNPIDWR